VEVNHYALALTAYVTLALCAYVMLVSCLVRKVQDRQAGQCRRRCRCISGLERSSTKKNFCADCLKVTKTIRSCGAHAGCSVLRHQPSSISVIPCMCFMQIVKGNCLN